jgi:hypothetical protein
VIEARKNRSRSEQNRSKTRLAAGSVRKPGGAYDVLIS